MHVYEMWDPVSVKHVTHSSSVDVVGVTDTRQEINLDNLRAVEERQFK